MTTRASRSHSATARLVVVAVVVVLVACSEPPLPEGPVDSDEADSVPLAEEPDDGDRDELMERLDELHATVEAASDHLEEAAAATRTSQARAGADRALGRLLEDAGTRAPGPPVLPAVALEREDTGARTDLLSTTLALARDVGGATGTAVVNLLRDEVAGDLGAWERDAAGVVASVERAAASTADLDQLTEAILDLSGEVTRALAWTMVAAEANDLDAATTAAERAAAHLRLVLFAIDELRGELGAEAGG